MYTNEWSNQVESFDRDLSRGEGFRKVTAKWLIELMAFLNFMVNRGFELFAILCKYWLTYTTALGLRSNY